MTELVKEARQLLGILEGLDVIGGGADQQIISTPLTTSDRRKWAEGGPGSLMSTLGTFGSRSRFHFRTSLACRRSTSTMTSDMRSKGSCP